MRCMKSSIRIKVGKQIRKLREKKHLTQDALAELAGIDYKYIQRIEGKTPPNLKLETIERLTEALGTSLPKFFDF